MKLFIKRFTDWYHWPFALFHFPLFFVWVWYCIKSRSIWFFSSSNPTLAFGGFEGETKQEMYHQLSKCLYPSSLFIHPETSFLKVVQQVNEHKISYPFIVKPDIGMKGILFRKIDNEQQLKLYHQHMPAAYILQELIDMPLEVSVFYYRYPNQEKGGITAFIQKNLLSITGNGTDTIATLIEKQGLAKNFLNEAQHNHRELHKKILPKGEVLYLSYIGNRYHGAEFIDLKDEIDDQLLQLFDDISHATSFYYGRYDIKCVSARHLKEKNGFSILEFNGAGSIPNHIYAGNFSLLQAYREMIRHWKILYQISACNHKNGFTYWSFLRGYQYLQKSKAHFNILKKLDKNLVLPSDSA